MTRKISRRDFLRGSAAGILGAALTGIVGGPVSIASAEETTTPGGERYEKIRVGLSSDPSDLIPYRPNQNSNPYFYWEIYEALFDIVDGDYVPALAQSYEEVDELHWNVTIYDYIKDSAGNPITADDVVYSYNWLIDSGEYSQMEIYGGIEKVDDYTVQFTWNYAPEAVLALEGPLCRVMIFSQVAMENNSFATSPVATGAYVVTSFTAGASVVLEANDDYWALGTEAYDVLTPAHYANVQTIEYKIITESTQQTVGMQTRSLDFSDSVASDTLSTFEEGGAYSEGLVVSTELSNMFLMLDCNNSPDAVTSDMNLRKAIYYAMDNSALSAIVGNMEPAYALGTSYFPDYVSDWENTETYINTYDVELAKEYLAQSSYNGESLRIVCGTDEETKNLATMVNALLTQIGVTSEVNSVDSSLRSSVTHDTTAWELKIQERGSALLIGAYNSFLNHQSSYAEYAKELPDVITATFIEDETLIEYYNAAANVNTYSDETMTALMEYAIENAYAYAIGGRTKSTVYTEDIAELYYREGQYATMGGSTFYL
ncbi:MAG: ABC transporter substrate-binding protein [Clostridiales bacterium]|nr:ABC transporter substrate-binding protein [Clostridiales bacterium]